VLLSGVVAPRRGQESEADPNRVYYECSQEARTILLHSLHEADAQQIAESLQTYVSRYIERIHGRAITFQALVPDENGNYELPDWAQPFARLGVSLLGLPTHGKSARQLVDEVFSTLPPSVVGGADFVGSTVGVGGIKVGLDEEQLVEVLAARGLLQHAESAGLQRRAIINLASRLRSSGEQLDFEQAVTELERAVEIALDVVRHGQRGSNGDDFVGAVLGEVANRTKSDDLDGAARALDDALAEFDRQGAEQREAARRKRVVFLEAAVVQHTLRRDAQAVAARIEMLVALDQPTDRPAWLPAFRQRLDAFRAEGETKGINFSLLVAIELSRRMAATARNEEEHWTAAIRLGTTLQTLGERESGK
jgi:hypothetical protein